MRARVTPQTNVHRRFPGDPGRVNPFRMRQSPSARTRPSRVLAAQRGAEIFHRPPREWPEPAPSEELRIHAPPTKPEPPTGGMVHAMFPAIGSFGLLAFALVYNNPLFMYIALGLVCLEHPARVPDPLLAVAHGEEAPQAQPAQVPHVSHARGA